MEAIADVVVSRWFTPDAPRELVAAHRAMLVSTPPDGYAATCEAVAAWDFRDRLGEIRADDARDRRRRRSAAPLEYSELIADGVPSSRLVVLDRAAHLANVERADAFSELVDGTPPTARGGRMSDDGMRIRREVLGDEHVDRAVERHDARDRGVPGLDHALRLGRDLGAARPRPAHAQLHHARPCSSRSAASTSSRCTSAPRSATASRGTRSRRCSSSPRCTAACPPRTARSRVFRDVLATLDE